jgi:uncharacterized membrane protein
MIVVASKVCLAFGGLLIVAGIVWLIVAGIVGLQRRRRAAPEAPFEGLSGLVRVFTALISEFRHHPQPLRLIYLGVLLLLVGAGLSVIA